MAFLLRSPAFEPGEFIPRKFTRDGSNVSPPLRWEDAPPATKSFALIVEDPDAPSGTFRHWSLYNIAANRMTLEENFDKSADGEIGHGTNDFKRKGYDGPQPPAGDDAHHYHFKLAALDTDALELPAKPTAADVWRAAQPHILDQTELIGLFRS